MLRRSPLLAVLTLLAVPAAEVTLAIRDDGAPPRTLAEHADVRLVAPEQVPGVLARYHAAGPGGASALLDAVPASAGFVEQRPTMAVSGALQVGGSPFTSDVLVQVSGTFGSRQEEAQRLGRILRPKSDGGEAHFYSLVTRDTVDQDFAQNRQLFLTEQGYSYRIVDDREVG